MNYSLLEKSSMLAFSAILMLSTMLGTQTATVVSANAIPAPPINHIFIRSNGTVDPPTL